MPPLLSQSALVTPSVAQAPPLHHVDPPALFYPAWNNPPPKSFSQLDRSYVLQSENGQFLEMHPNGTRGVNNFTQYCILTIYMLNITTLNANITHGAPHLHNWTTDKSPSSRLNGQGQQTRPLKVIRSSTGNYLCMDNASVIFQKATYDANYCSFEHDYDTRRYRDRYFRMSNPGNSQNNTRWYVGINKDGTIRCGNVTRKNQDGANFHRIDIKSDQLRDSPPFEKTRRKCCPKKKCRNRKCKEGRRKCHKKSSSKDTPSTPEKQGREKRRCYVNWCKKRRRQFFKLKLKDVYRYYNRCIVRKNEIRHCKKS